MLFHPLKQLPLKRIIRGYRSVFSSTPPFFRFGTIQSLCIITQNKPLKEVSTNLFVSEKCRQAMQGMPTHVYRASRVLNKGKDAVERFVSQTDFQNLTSEMEWGE